MFKPIADWAERIARREDATRDSVAFVCVLLASAGVAFADALLSATSGPIIRAYSASALALVMLVMIPFVLRTKTVDLFLTLTTFAAMGLFVWYFYLSGDIYYLAVALVVPIIAALFASARISVYILMTYVVLTMLSTLALANNLWTPAYEPAVFHRSMASEALSICLVAIALSMGALWKTWLTRIARIRSLAINEELAAQHRRINTIREATHDAMIETDECGMITSVTGELEAKLGYEKDALVGRMHFSLLEREDGRRIMNSATIRDDGNYGFTGEARAICANGSQRWVRVLGGTFYASDGKRRWATMVQDIEKEVANRSNMFEISRLDSLEDVCGGLAHDFNNLLTVIGVYCELLGDSEERKGILEAQRQASELTHGLLAFARKQEFRNRVFDVNSHLQEVKGIVERLLPATIQCSWHFKSITLPVKIDPAQLQQVVINLVTNAMHSMPEGGALSITTGLIQIDQHEAERYSIDRGEYVSVRVRDTGFGMDQDVQDRAFEPFFTTKPRGHGSGLGLSTVLGVCRQVGGSVRISSRVREGTTIEVLLPRSDEPVQVPDPTATLADMQAFETKSEERILVVDDREVLGRALRRTLSMLGYNVTYLTTAEDALQFLDSAETQQLLITDIVLPGMNGIELVRKVRAEQPDTKALLISAYEQNNVTMIEPHETEITRFLRKPFRTREFLAATRALLRVE